MLGGIARTPGYASVLRPVRGEGTVPSVYNVISQILGFFEVFLIAGQFVGFEQFADDPLLVVIDVVYSGYGGTSRNIGPVYTVDRPVPGLGI